jgi:hypothetical protein
MLFEPGNSFVFAGENGLSVLVDSNYVIVDGTFDLMEEKLVLTTLMRYHDSIAILSAYYLLDLKTHESYLKYFQVYCKTKHANVCLIE